MLLLILLVPVVLGTLIPPDYYHEHLMKFVDRNADPCDNFYRHVCPRTIRQEDTVAFKTRQFLTHLVREEWWRIGGKSYETIAKNLNSLMSKTLPKNTTEEHLAETLAVILGLPRMVALDAYLIKHHLYPELIEKTTELETYFSFIKKEMEYDISTLANLNFKLRLKLAMHKTLYNITMDNYAIILSQEANKWNGITNETFDLIYKFTDNLRENITATKNFRKFMNKVMNYLEYSTAYGPTFNAAYSPHKNIVSLNANSLFLLLQIQNDHLKHAVATMLLGHELSHAFVNKRLIKQSKIYSNKAKCVLKKYTDACKFKEEGQTCTSDLSTTHGEDGCDLQGTRLAYRSYERRYATQLNQSISITPTFSLTNQQLFFYAHAITFCSANAGYAGEEHSGPLFRVNAMMPEVSSFADAFKCKPGDRMYQPKEEQCIVWGREPVFRT